MNPANHEFEVMSTLINKTLTINKTLINRTLTNKREVHTQGSESAIPIQGDIMWDHSLLLIMCDLTVPLNS